MFAVPPSAAAPAPPEASEQLMRVARLATRPLEMFLRVEAASGIVLLAAAAAALAWANSPWSASYQELWHLPVGFRLGELTFERSLEWFVNDVLMVIFFFVVGMEIRREVHDGELSEWRRAALPAAAALGGMIAPALLYLAVAGDVATRSGWGIPMATDIAFAVGILTLLGKRVPAALRVLLLALAVIDDLGAILVIALFYSSSIDVSAMALAAIGFAGIVLMQRFGIRSRAAYVAPAAIGWAGIYGAGIHPTIAGVIVGLLTPARAWLGPERFAHAVRSQFSALDRPAAGTTGHEKVDASLRHIDVARREAVSPAQGLIAALHPWVAFVIMPVFALANAGVTIGAAGQQDESTRVVAAVVIGLVAGKPLGILLACRLALWLKIGVLPAGLGMRHLLVLGVVAGVGFTMSLFIANLAFTDHAMLSAAKIGVLGASGVAAVAALVLGRMLLEPASARGLAATADEAEASTGS
jgi:Na+:H+ antiporter, NhaA family